MRYLHFLAIVSAVNVLCFDVSISSAAPTECVYDAKTLTGKGCAENFKCSPSGRCETAFTVAEIEQAVAPAPELPKGFDPPPLFLCDGKNGWGMVNNKCLPTCEKLRDMWQEHLKINNIDPNKRWATSYIELKLSCEYKPSTINLEGCMQGVISSVYKPKDLAQWKCCAKLCKGDGPVDPAPPDYSKIPAPTLGDPSAPPSPGPEEGPKNPSAVPTVKLGPPLNPVTGKPLPSGPDPMNNKPADSSRPFGNGPAPKKPK